MAQKYNPAIFREYDVRGLAGKDLSSGLAFDLGRAFSLFLKKNNAGKLRVAVGRDCRLSGEEYAAALTEGLRTADVDVVSLGVCPTPVTYYSLFHLSVDGAIMVTGSHNPAEYNGFKIAANKTTLHGPEIQELRKIIESLPPVGSGSNKGKLESYAIVDAYVAEMIDKFKGLRKLKVVLDAGNGVAGNTAPQIFRELCAEVTELYCDLDGRFPNHHPDPTVPANLKALVAEVKKRGADFGVAFDGDGDRIGVVDETGRILFGDELMVVFSRDVLRNHPKATIISEVKSSHRLYQDIAKHGGNPIMWKTGHSLIKAKMKESGAKLAGEMSGHIFFADEYYGYDDAIYAALRYLRITAQHKGKASSLLSDLPPSFSTPELRLDCEESLKFALVKKVKEAFVKNEKVNDLDGVRIDFGDGWGLLRASNTQPVLVLRFESEKDSRLLEIANLFKETLVAAGRSLGHPPFDFPKEFPGA